MAAKNTSRGPARPAPRSKSKGGGRKAKKGPGKSLNPVKWWREMDPGRKAFIVKSCGLLVGVFALFTLIACVSYLIHWKTDQSLLGDPQAMDPSVTVGNSAGKLGVRWANLLIGRLFGLGSFALVVTLFIISARLVFGRSSFPVLRAVLLSLGAAFVVSLLSGFAGYLAGASELWGGGPGGECGDFAIDWTVERVGIIITGVALVVVTVLWFVLASKRFSDWFRSIGKSRDNEGDDIGDVPVEGDDAEVVHLPDDQPEPASEPAPEEEVQVPPEEKKPRFSFRKLFSRIIDKAVIVEDDEDDSGRQDGEDDPGTEAGQGEDVPGTPPVVATTKQDAPSGVQRIVPETIPEEDIVEPVEPETPPKPAGGKNIIEVVDMGNIDTKIDEDLPNFDPVKELPNYEMPSLTLLGEHLENQHKVSDDELKRNNLRIRNALKTYKIEVDNVRAVVGPTVTLYKVYPAPGVKIAAIRALQDDIAMALKASGVRVVTLNDSVGIEVPNDTPSMVPLRAVLNDDLYRNSKAELPVAIGYTTLTQKVKVFDLADAPHLLVAGATKQGKSVGLNVLIASLLYSKHPSELKMVFIDPKMVEFSAYGQMLHHYLAVVPSNSEQEEKENAIAKTPKAAEAVLKSLCMEMDERYKLLSTAMVNNIKLYNRKWKERHLLPTEGHKFMPYIVVVVDEFADLTMSAGTSGEAKQTAKSISTSIIRLAQKGRAAGIHVVLATQRPSVDVITGLIKSNFPTRIAYRVFSNTDSRTILDNPGAEKLIGNGDMIFYAGEAERSQCAFISNDEINALTRFIGSQTGHRKSYNTPYYLPEPEPDQAEEGTSSLDASSLDERFEEAARLVVTTQRGSTSDIQRRLGMGYAKAGRVMDQLEQAGIVGPQQGAKPRQVLIDDLIELERILDSLRG